MSRHHVAGRVIAWTAVITLCLGGIAGAAFAAAPNASPSPTPGNSAHKKHEAGAGGKAGAFGRRTVHGEFVAKAKDGKYVTTYVQRGAVTAVSPTSVTVRSSDGFSATYTINSDSKIRKDGEQAAIGTIKVGDPVLVMAVKGTDGKTARGLAVRTAR